MKKGAGGRLWVTELKGTGPWSQSQEMYLVILKVNETHCFLCKL